jgi:hypothetical protein
MESTTSIPSPGGGEKIRCNECRASVGSTPAFPRTAVDIKHRETCSCFVAAAQAKVVVTAAQAEIARQGAVSHAGLTDDQIVEAVNAGKISANDALNRDY